jgi:hypothetical protein
MALATNSGNGAASVWKVSRSRQKAGEVCRKQGRTARGGPVDQSYTFLCLRPDGVEAHLDVQVLADAEQVRAHGARLLQDHRSCVLVEVWTGSQRLMLLSRQPASAGPSD